MNSVGSPMELAGIVCLDFWMKRVNQETVLVTECSFQWQVAVEGNSLLSYVD